MNYQQMTKFFIFVGLLSFIMMPQTLFASNKTSNITMAHSYETVLSRDESVALLKRRIGRYAKTDYTFKQVKLDQFLSAFSKEHKLNIVNDASNIQKPVSFSLRKIHPADLFDTVISSFQGDWYIKDGLLRVVDRKPVRTFQLNYIQVEEAEKAIKDSVSLQGMTIVESTNTIIARGDEEKLDQLAAVIKAIDVVPMQVLIEARILETSTELTEELGFNIINTLEQGGSLKSILTSGYLDDNEGTPQRGLFLKVVDNDLTSELDAVNNNSDTKVLANPKLLVTNHNTAKIITGQRLGFTTVTQTETATVENVQFLETGVKLEFTPHISESGNILLEILPEVSEGRVENNLPRETTTQTNTQVMVGNGQTIVIGGLIQNKKQNQVNGVPILSDIPILNLFFQKSIKEDLSREILIVITPHIVGTQKALDPQQDSETQADVQSEKDVSSLITYKDTTEASEIVLEGEPNGIQ